MDFPLKPGERLTEGLVTGGTRKMPCRTLRWALLPVSSSGVRVYPAMNVRLLAPQRQGP